MLTWEQLDVTPGIFNVYRAKVPGGWLVAIAFHDGQGLTFYPDPNHSWDVQTADDEYDSR
jgi:hypothetical protein